MVFNYGIKLGVIYDSLFLLMNNFVEIFQESVNLWDGRRIRKNQDIGILFIFQKFVS